VFWIFAGVALVLLLIPARYRKIGFGAAGLIFIVFLGIVVFNRRPTPDARPAVIEKSAAPTVESRRFDFDQYERDKKDKEDPEATTRIPLSAIRFDQVSSNAGIESGSIQTIRARLYNDSHDFALTDYAYYLRIQDCLPANAGTQCTTVYDQRGTASLLVPPNQARDVTIAIQKNPTTLAAPFKLLGTARIELTPAETRSYRTADQ
jgi:hypothetical protein